MESSFPNANYNRGLAYAKLGEFPAAIEDYTQALRLNPNHAGAYNNRGNAYYKLGEYEKAIADYDACLALNPNFPDVQHNRDVAQGVWDEKRRQEARRREEEKRLEEEKRREAELKQREEELKRREAELKRQEEEKRQEEAKTRFTFDVITVDNRGKQTSKVPKQAQYYRQDLGNGVFIDMVAIPEGKFQMGTPDSEPNRQSNESPQHQVTVPSFYLAKYPITQAQYKAIMAQNPSHFQGSDLPVEMVSWNNAVEFCQKLAQNTKQAYRLPSEAEWEYACRAGTTTPFHFGDTITTDLANYNGDYTYGNGPKGEFRQKTTPVGSFPPNAWGLYDMHGNVWEWCQDVWHGNYDNAPTDGTAWETGGNPNIRVLRGGSWGNFPRNCRSGQRRGNDWGDRYYNYGFRVAVSQLPSPGL